MTDAPTPPSPGDTPEVPLSIQHLLKGFKWGKEEKDYYLGEGARSANSLLTRDQRIELHEWLESYGLIDCYRAKEGSRKDFSISIGFATINRDGDGGVDCKMLPRVGMERVHLSFSKTTFAQMREELPELLQLQEQGKQR